MRKSLDSKDAAGSEGTGHAAQGFRSRRSKRSSRAKNNEEATKWAGEGKSHADSILVNLGMNNIEAAKTSITPLGGTCASCHGKYRERMEDGTFRIKTAG